MAETVQWHAIGSCDADIQGRQALSADDGGGNLWHAACCAPRSMDEAIPLDLNGKLTLPMRLVGVAA
jgi:hypothetical protein